MELIPDEQKGIGIDSMGYYQLTEFKPIEPPVKLPYKYCMMDKWFIGGN